MLTQTLDEAGQPQVNSNNSINKVAITLPAQHLQVVLTTDEFVALQKEMHTAIHNQLVGYANLLKQWLAEYAKGFSLLQSLLDTGRKMKVSTPQDWASTPYLQSGRKKLRLFMETAVSHMLVEATTRDPLKQVPGSTFCDLGHEILSFAEKRTALVELEPSSLSFDAIISDPAFSTPGQQPNQTDSIFSAFPSEYADQIRPRWLDASDAADESAYLLVSHKSSGIPLKIPVVLCDRWFDMSPLRRCVSALEAQLSAIYAAINQLTAFTIGISPQGIKDAPHMHAGAYFMWEIRDYAHPDYQLLADDEFSALMIERFVRYLPEFLLCMSRASFSDWDSVSAPRNQIHTI